jgi:hypothetical protein
MQKTSNVVYAMPKPDCLCTNSGIHVAVPWNEKSETPLFAITSRNALNHIDTQIIESVVTVDLDDDDKIVRVTDEWDGQELSRSIGWIMFRKICGKVAEWVVRIPST